MERQPRSNEQDQAEVDIAAKPSLIYQYNSSMIFQ